MKLRNPSSCDGTVAIVVSVSANATCEDARCSIGLIWSGGERDVDVFEEGLSGDSFYAARELDEVIAGLTGLFAAKSVGKHEGFRKLTGAHQKTRAVNSPLAFEIHGISQFSVSATEANGLRRCFFLFDFGRARLPRGDDCFQVERLYLQKPNRSITQELCNGGILACGFARMNRNQVRDAVNGGWRREGRGLSGTSEIVMDDKKSADRILHIGRTG